MSTIWLFSVPQCAWWCIRCGINNNFPWSSFKHTSIVSAFSSWKVNCKYCDAMEFLPSLVLNHVWIFYIKICASCEPFVFWSLPVQQRVTCQWAWIACEALCHHHGHQSHLCPGSLVTFLGLFIFLLLLAVYAALSPQRSIDLTTNRTISSFKLKSASQNFPYKYLQLIQNQNK